MIMSQEFRYEARRNDGTGSRVLQRTISVLVLVLLMWPLSACKAVHRGDRPKIIFRVVPVARAGAAERLELIEGKIENSTSVARIVLYAWSIDTWWVQPFRSHPFTQVRPDGSWAAPTHLGTQYAALLVSDAFKVPVKLVSLPPVAGDVLASAVTEGRPGNLAPKTLSFSGYEWEVRSSIHTCAGELCDYDPANAWVDARGHLHLHMGQEKGLWQSAGIKLTRSLGYGTYRFAIAKHEELPPSATLAMFTRAEREDPNDRAELDIELGQWGKSKNLTGAFVVQPYYIPDNNHHFKVPAGNVTYFMRWDPGVVEFRAVGNHGVPAKTVSHVFRSGVPVPATETVHIDLFDFHHAQSALQSPVDVVVEKFEYLP